jgi:ATP-dependent Clp protease ATP-binding subunit ClpB
VRQRPYSVLLFDEVEKAHQDVFNLLLQVLDDGRLTDGRGRLADFTNTVVILTSNIGSKLPATERGEAHDGEAGVEELASGLRAELGNFFRPEFLNRIGDVVVFGSLTREHLRRIVDIQLDKVRKLLAPRDLTLEVGEDAKLRLVELGYEPAFGARPLERTIVRQVQDPIAEGLMAGAFKSGQTLEIALVSDALVLRVKAVAAS